MIVTLKLIKISKVLTLLRPATIIIALAPLFLIEKIELLKGTNFDGIWMLIWLFIFVVQIKTIKRFNVIGQIRITQNNITITFDNKYTRLINITENLKISMNYKGYKGEDDKYNIMQIPLFKREGIGHIEILTNNVMYKYSFVAQEKCAKRLAKFAEIYKQQGVEFNIK
ncbi:MAG: hypothetical protein CVU09_01530 [Bacteroidetes bacterium HGW-Bacteroidetes-4]|jgi:hypothetical protein|nr:MAG: hypothetical protein CVU09_01530 [Bacteroidetes bacterium HGW-Bacteroidetes-4]